jgi:hypothetical protein
MSLALPTSLRFCLKALLDSRRSTSLLLRRMKKYKKIKKYPLRIREGMGNKMNILHRYGG